MSRKAPRNYLPQGPVRFDKAVDSVSRSLLGRRASAASIKAAAQLVQIEPTATIKSRDELRRLAGRPGDRHCAEQPRTPEEVTMSTSVGTRDPIHEGRTR